MHPLSSHARRALHGRLARIRRGHLVLQDADGTRAFGDRAASPIEIRMLDARAYRAIAFGGAVGAGESFAEGWWTTSDLTGVVRLLVQNREALDGLERGWARLVQPVRRAAHALNRNSRRGSRRNIGAHYDLGNEFFAAFLDETMTYSSGLFERPDTTLAEASRAKYDRMAALVELQARDHVLEIGTGWGGFAIHAAQRYGCRVTTTTISAEQHAHATRRVAALGLAERVTVLREDYRDLTGTYDKIVSIEMIEAVGHEHFDTFFTQCAARLAPGGRLAIQAITIADERYESARREVDFIKRHIFPGSCIPSRTILGAAAERAGLRVERVDEMGLHYAETVRRWRQRMLAARGQLTSLGFDARFQRLWEFYFCYCEGGFLERAIGTAQLTVVPADAATSFGVGATIGASGRVPDVPLLTTAA